MFDNEKEGFKYIDNFLQEVLKKDDSKIYNLKIGQHCEERISREAFT